MRMPCPEHASIPQAARDRLLRAAERTNPTTRSDPVVQRLVDEAAIRRLLARYSRAIDR